MEGAATDGPRQSSSQGTYIMPCFARRVTGTPIYDSTVMRMLNCAASGEKRTFKHGMFCPCSYAALYE